VIGLVVVLALGCGDEPEAKEAVRREMLTPPDRAKQRAEFEERVALVDDKGNLLESDQKVAELTLPRGIELLKEREHLWRYTSNRVTLKQLDEYFATRLFTAEIDRRFTGQVTYLRAHIKAAPKAPRVNVTITPRDDQSTRVDLQIEEIARRAHPKRNPSEAEIRAKLEERRKWAD
jgi:hypothetical protein